MSERLRISWGTFWHITIALRDYTEEIDRFDERSDLIVLAIRFFRLFGCRIAIQKEFYLTSTDDNLFFPVPKCHHHGGVI